MTGRSARVRDVECQQDGCEATYRDHRWGATRAHADGWFIGMDGRAWCPEHNPSWVAEWRRKKEQA